MPGVVGTGIIAIGKNFAGIRSRKLAIVLYGLLLVSTVSCSYLSRNRAPQTPILVSPVHEMRHKTENFLAYKIQKINPKSNARKLSKLIVSTSEKEAIDPFILASIVKHESTFKGTVHSSRGAAGLMQIMPSTAKYMSRQLGVEWRGNRALLHPEYNLKLGIRYLHYLKKRFKGDTRLALIAYNWGPTNLERSLKRRAPFNASAMVYAQRILTLHSVWQQEFTSFTHRTI